MPIQTEQEVQLTDLTDEIISISGAGAWLTAVKSNNEKNSVKLVAKTNEGDSERSCILTVTDKTGDKVLLTVTQSKFDVDDSHDLVTDQPAYIPSKR